MAYSTRSYIFYGLLVYYLSQETAAWKTRDYFNGAVYPVLRSAFASYVSGSLLSIGMENHLNDYIVYLAFDLMMHGLIATILSEVFWPTVGFVFFFLVLSAIVVVIADAAVDWCIRIRGRRRRCENGSIIVRFLTACLIDMTRSCLGLGHSYVGCFLEEVCSVFLESPMSTLPCVVSRLFELAKRTWRLVIAQPFNELSRFMRQVTRYIIIDPVRRIPMDTTISRLLQILYFVCLGVISDCIYAIGRYAWSLWHYVAMGPLTGLTEMIRLVWKCARDYVKDSNIDTGSNVKFKGRWTSSLQADQSSGNLFPSCFDFEVSNPVSTADQSQQQVVLYNCINRPEISALKDNGQASSPVSPTPKSRRNKPRRACPDAKIMVTRSGSQYKIRR